MTAIKRLHRAVAAAALALTTTAQAPGPQTGTGTLPGGARWIEQVPSDWNGTLLLYSRGYSPRAGDPELAPRGYGDALLAQGYALLATDYGSGGWALEEAVPAQREALADFVRRHGKPKRVIAWGYSMGGLVTTALAEAPGSGIDGAAPMCASIGGSLGMMNMALDGAYAFRTLVAPDAGIRLVRIDDDRANGKRVGDALDIALRTPTGRARVALAGVLGGIPDWTSVDRAAPAAGDAEAAAGEIARTFVMGVYLPRADQEARAGGVFSWNTGVDYRAQLKRSGRQAMVAALYARAGLDLDADLDRLNEGERVAANPRAVAYMRAHYTPNARPLVPLLAVQTMGDGLTAPAMQRGYAEAARGDVRSIYANRAGHCTFSAEEVVGAIRMLDGRISQGRWPTPPANFQPHRPVPMLRPCIRGGACR